jgi:hypothetical protein
MTSTALGAEEKLKIKNSDGEEVTRDTTPQNHGAKNMSEFDTRMIDALAADGVKPFDLNEAFEKLHSLYGSRNKATETLRTQIMDLEKQIEAISEPYDQQIADLQAKIAEEVKFTGKSFKCSYGKATYRKEYERTSWDTKALMGYAATHPEIEQFKKTSLVEASVTISVGDLE